MSKQKMKEEREDFLAENISEGMKFQVIEKNKLSKRDLDGEGISVIGMSNFKFKRDDIIKIEESGKKSVTFYVEREGKKFKNDQDKTVYFKFNRLIFVQRFESFTDLNNIVDNITDVYAGEISDIMGKKNKK
ncbi:hypothetical protein GW846_01975 [Candidatus Gracilibacteria bacterium]|nr:hypothetical protein [Candidatus Gracilibacteria bacterium]